MAIPQYLTDLVDSFLKKANPEAALPMKKYVKDRYDYLGITSPERRELYKVHWQKHGLIPHDKTEEIVKWCWETQYREYQYFAMESLGKNAKIAEKSIIDLYEYMITHKSWWETVDFIAPHLIGVYFSKYPDQIKTTTNKWMASGNMWLHRTCILFQLKYKSKTDTLLLESFIEPLTESKEFFIRKAIGWALREYSKTNPEYVIQFVNTHRLSGLSEREALKWMKNKSITG